MNRVELTDPITAYQSAPGYQEMQSIMSMQQTFIILVALLVIGGFFQIQALQKVAQIGMLKAIGASNRVVAFSILAQVILTTIIGMTVGGWPYWAWPLRCPYRASRFQRREDSVIIWNIE